MYYVLEETWLEFRSRCGRHKVNHLSPNVTFDCELTEKQCSENKCPRIKCSAYNKTELKQVI